MLPDFPLKVKDVDVSAGCSSELYVSSNF